MLSLTTNIITSPTKTIQFLHLYYDESHSSHLIENTYEKAPHLLLSIAWGIIIDPSRCSCRLSKIPLVGTIQLTKWFSSPILHWITIQGETWPTTYLAKQSSRNSWFQDSILSIIIAFLSATQNLFQPEPASQPADGWCWWWWRRCRRPETRFHRPRWANNNNVKTTSNSSSIRLLGFQLVTSGKIPCGYVERGALLPRGSNFQNHQSADGCSTVGVSRTRSSGCHLR